LFIDPLLNRNVWEAALPDPQTAGKYGGRKPSLTAERAAELRRQVAAGGSKAALAREFGISRDTLYRYVPVRRRGK
jgi:DNA invertase Pin-like site-specific DNA recombinase